jgi:hypothetical protein
LIVARCALVLQGIEGLRNRGLIRGPIDLCLVARGDHLVSHLDAACLDGNHELRFTLSDLEWIVLQGFSRVFELSRLGTNFDNWSESAMVMPFEFD